MQTLKAVAFVVAWACVWAGGARAMTIVKEGRPTATIVVSEAAFKAKPFVPQRGAVGTEADKVRLAADDLQRYIEKISGAKLPIVSDAGAPAGPRILVGRSKLTGGIRGLSIPSGLTPERNEDGYVLFCRDDTLVLAGNDEGPYLGTYYAVAEFLNRLGVRWITPSDFGDVVPSQKTVTVAPVNFTDRPTFRLRTWWCNIPADMGRQESLWKIRNKMQIADGALVGIPGDSWLRAYLPDPALAKKQPELFGRNLDQTVNPYMPNLSNPEAAKLVADKVIAAIRKSEQAGQRVHALGFAPDDGLPMDHTPKTMNELNQGFTTWVGREGVPTELSITEEWFTFMNRVCEQVAKVYPDVIITTNGYANRCLPPEGVRLPANMGVMYAPIWADTTKPFFDPKSWHGQIQAMQVQRWCQLCRRVFLYNYNDIMLVSLLTPVPQMHRIAANYAWYYKCGVIGFFNETSMAAMQDGMVTRYTRARMMWNARLDVDALLADYFSRWYGPAAKPAAAFWKGLEDSLLNSPLLGHEDRILPYVYSDKLLAALEKDVKAAEALASAEPYKTRVRIDRLTLEHLKAYMALHAAEFDGHYGEAAAEAEKMIALRKQLHAISHFLVWPPVRTGIERYYAHEHYYGALDRRDHFTRLHDMISGKTGDLVAMAPKTARFTLDEASIGKDLHWYRPSLDRSKWCDIDTTKPYYMQGYLSPNGIPYEGKMWYVFELAVPAAFAGRPIRVYSPVVTSQAWVWVNGRYAGSRKYLEAYIRPAPIDMDVTGLIEPGKKNMIAVWVSTGTNRTQAADGFQGRLFLYSPKPAAGK